MKTITKIFGAFAAVALFAACSSEETLELTENQAQAEVPAGMHQVTLTVSKDQAKQMVGKKRIHMDDSNGNLSWDLGDDIAVVYSDGKVYQFNLAHIEGTDESVARFVGYVPEDVFTTYGPTDVYSNYVDGYTQDAYKEISNNQLNLTNFDNGFLLQEDIETGSNPYGIHLHGVVDASVYGQGRVDVFYVALTLDHAAMVRIAKENLPTITGNKVTVKVGSIEYDAAAPVEYTIHDIDKDKDGVADADLTFFVQVDRTQGLTNAEITVGGSNHTFHTDWNSNTKKVWTIEAGKRYILTPSMYALVYDGDVLDGSIYYGGSDYATTTWNDAKDNILAKKELTFPQDEPVKYEDNYLFTINQENGEYSWSEILGSKKLKPQYAPVFNRKNDVDVSDFVRQ